MLLLVRIVIYNKTCEIGLRANQTRDSFLVGSDKSLEIL